MMAQELSQCRQMSVWYGSAWWCDEIDMIREGVASRTSIYRYIRVQGPGLRLSAMNRVGVRVRVRASKQHESTSPPRVRPVDVMSWHRIQESSSPLGSVVERLTSNEEVVGSTPAVGS